MMDNKNLTTQGSDPDRPSAGVGALEEGLKEAGNEGTGGLIGAGAGDEAQGEIVSPREFLSGGTAAAFAPEDAPLTAEDVHAYDENLADAGTAVGDGLGKDDDAIGMTI